MELFLFMLLFRDLSAVQSQAVPAVLAQIFHVDPPAAAAGWDDWGPGEMVHLSRLLTGVPGSPRSL